MMEAWAMAVAGWLLAPVCSALVVALREQRRRTREATEEAACAKESHEAAQNQMLLALGRSKLVDAHEAYVTNGRPLTVERKHEITETYEAYKDLGGNGTGEAMYAAICEVPITIVT